MAQVSTSDPEEAAPVEPMEVPSQESPEADQTKVPQEQLELSDDDIQPLNQ